MTERDAYYFAGGQRIELRADPDHVAVDLDRARGVPRSRQDALRRAGRPLRGGVVLLAAGAVRAEDREELEAAGAILPAYRADDATIVVLPEVRVECRDAEEMAGLREQLAKKDVDPSSLRERRGTLSFAPRSGRAEDALRLANEIYEELEPTASQARFLRVVARLER